MEKTTSLKPLLLSKRESAALLAVSLRTLENLIARRELSIRRIGRRTLVPYAALEAFAKRDHATHGRKEQPVATEATASGR